MVINLRNYVLGVFHVVSYTMRRAHGSINKILLEWDPQPTYDVQRLWDPGGSTDNSRSSVSTNLDRLGKPKSYLDYIHLPGLSPLSFLVAVKPNLAPSNHLEKLDCMGSFRYLPRLDQPGSKQFSDHLTCHRHCRFHHGTFRCIQTFPLLVHLVLEFNAEKTCCTHPSKMGGSENYHNLALHKSPTQMS